MAALSGGGTSTLWQLLALSDEELELADVVVMNLTVAKEIPSLANLDIAHYIRIVDSWTEQFKRVLPSLEAQFHKTPHHWNNNIRFFRVGQLQGFLCQEIGIRYIEDQMHATKVQYTNPADLFLNGLLDTKQGTCGSMPVLHVAMARRMGWPVSLACAKNHFLSRFNDGQGFYNIESTNPAKGFFACASDESYIKEHKLPSKAVSCGSDLRSLTAREMIGVFLSLRGRHYQDTQRWLEADQTLALARAVFPRHRNSYFMAVVPWLKRGYTLFDVDELGHPNSIFEELVPELAPKVWSSFCAATANGKPFPQQNQTIQTAQHSWQIELC